MDEPYREHPIFQRGLELLGRDPFARLAAGTREHQPAIFLCSVVAWEQQRDAIEPYAAAGHSLGEYAALVAAGVLAFDDAVVLVAERAAAMADAADARAGGMVAMLGGDADAIRELAARTDLVVANDNAPGQLVLAGAAENLDRAQELAREQTGARARRLDVAGAFHSQLMAPAAQRLAAALARTPVSEPSFPVLSNGSTQPFVDVRRELAENMLKPVRWRETLLALHEQGVSEFPEIGPGEVLTGLVRRTIPAVAEPLAEAHA